MGVSVETLIGKSDIRTFFLPLLTDLNDFDIVHVMSPPYAALEGHKHLVVTVAEPVVTELPFYTRRAKLTAYPALFAESFVFRKRAHFIAISETTRRKIETHFALSESQISVIPCGVDCDSFAPGKKENDPPQIVLCSRLDKRKNISEALRAFSAISGLRGSMIIIGDGPERTELVEVAKKSNKEITFTGNIEPDELQAILSRSEIFVTTSLSEGFGLSLLEAMSAGCAVIVSNIGAHTELVRHMDNGLVYNTQNELTKMMELLLKNKELVRKLGTKARETALQYSWQNVAQRMIGLYESLRSPQVPTKS
jgi:glycosyltransferase involved in cell wall biosynthesis